MVVSISPRGLCSNAHQTNAKTMSQNIAINRHARQRRRLRSIIIGGAVGSGLGLLFALLLQGGKLGPLANGLINGMVIGGVGAVFENYVFQVRFRKLNFLTVLLIRSLIYAALVSVTVLLEIKAYRAVRYGIPLTEFSGDTGFMEFLTGGEFFAIFVFAVVGSFVINFLRQINRLLGQNVLLNYITGRYHKPIEEERIFLFLDMRSSTTIAERIGHLPFHQLINDCFFDLTEPIIESKGEIYQYVGDEIVVTWPMEKGLQDANCIRCFFAIADRMEELREEYTAKYGFIPEFKAGYHYGMVIIGEIGDVKKEIAFHGDPVNTTARIQAECNGFGTNILLSSDLLERLPATPELKPRRIGSIQLRGTEHAVELFTMEREIG